MKLASVILDIPTQALDAPYTYAVPEEAGDQPIEVGCAVLVPFGPRQAVGFVIAPKAIGPQVSTLPSSRASCAR